MRRSREEMKAILAIRDREGLSWAELAERTGVKASTLSWWSWKLRSEQRGRPCFAEVELTGEPEPAGSALLLRHGDIEIELRPGFDAGLLAEVLAVLRCC